MEGKPPLPRPISVPLLLLCSTRGAQYASALVCSAVSDADPWIHLLPKIWAQQRPSTAPPQPPPTPATSLGPRLSPAGAQLGEVATAPSLLYSNKPGMTSTSTRATPGQRDSASSAACSAHLAALQSAACSLAPCPSFAVRLPCSPQREGRRPHQRRRPFHHGELLLPTAASGSTPPSLHSSPLP